MLVGLVINLLLATEGLFYSLQAYEDGSKCFRPDIQKPRQMENAARNI